MRWAIPPFTHMTSQHVLYLPSLTLWTDGFEGKQATLSASDFCVKQLHTI